MTDKTPSDGHRAVAAGSDSGTSAERRSQRDSSPDRRDDRDVLRREKNEFGGMRFFLAFFGWLTATGAVVLLTALVTGILALIGVQNSVSPTPDQGQQQGAAIVSIAVLAFVLFVGYYIGGYVAGRMARFSGVKQGLAVWIWAVIIAILVAIIGAVTAGNLGAFSQLSGTGLPIDGATATGAGIASLIVAVVFSLAGALLGGRGGMRFHRKVDRFAANT